MATEVRPATVSELPGIFWEIHKASGATDDSKVAGLSLGYLALAVLEEVRELRQAYDELAIEYDVVERAAV